MSRLATSRPITAADLYGVIVDENGNLDAEATAARREEIS